MPPRQHSVQALKLRARAQTALPEQSMLLRHRAARKETEERCSVALLTAEIKVSCAPCCPAPPEACVGALGLVCMQASLTVPAPHRSQPRTTAHWARCTPRRRSCQAGGLACRKGNPADGAEPRLFFLACSVSKAYVLGLLLRRGVELKMKLARTAAPVHP